MHLAAFIALCIPLLAVARPVVPGFERFPRDTLAQQVTGGEVLITELNCVACHVAGEDQGRRFQHRPAPVLFTHHNPAGAGWMQFVSEPPGPGGCHSNRNCQGRRDAI